MNILNQGDFINGGTWEFNQTYQGPDEAQKGHMLMKPEFPFNWLID